MNRKISIFAYTLSIAGLAAESIALFPFSSGGDRTLFYIRSLLSSVQLDYFHLRFLEYHNFDSGQNMGYLTLFAYSLLLIGAIAYSRSKGKETRLIRYVFSLVLLFGIMSIISWMIYPVDMVVRIANIIKTLALCYGSFVFLRSISHAKQIKKVPEEGVATTPVMVSTPATTRLFHLVVDTLTCLFIFTQFAPFFSFLAPLENIFDEQFALLIFIGLIRFIYYVFFELLFKATPAKFLTESRVVADDETDPPANVIIGRTLSRFIPFEAFSFFGKRGWHDSFPQVKVVNEVTTGVPGGRYSWILPAIPFVVLVVFAVNQSIEKYDQRQYNISEHDQKIGGFQKQIKNLSTSHIIEILDTAIYYPSDETYLKIEEIKGDSVKAYVIIRPHSYHKSLRGLEQLYYELTEIESPPMVSIKRQDLENAYTPDYDQANGAYRKTSALMNDERKFEIKRIERLFCPNIQDRGTGGYGQDIYMDMLNIGWTANIVSLETLEGTIEWNEELPKNAPAVASYDHPDFNIRGLNYVRGQKYKFRMVVEDTLGRHYTYLVEGRNLKKTIELVE